MRMEEVWLIGSLAVTAPLLIVCALGWWRASRRARWLETQVLPASDRDAAAQRLEQVVEGLASQVNELADGHDFLQRILTKRTATPPAILDQPRAATPV
jgi:hypothetical protein